MDMQVQHGVRDFALGGGRPLRAADGVRVKRVLDVAMAALALIALAPLMAVLAVLVWSVDGGPALYRHRRIGRYGATFDCLKFRSMHIRADEVLAAYLDENASAREEWALNHKLRNDPRITRIGRFLRASSLDELPQLWNIVRGEMSMVGPRPIVTSEIEKYGPYFPDYCSCTPGLTGLWQVSGRNDVSYQERVLLDAHYARSRTLMMDAAILMRTGPAVFGRRGSY